MKTKATILAEKFLALADELNVQVSCFINGSLDLEDIRAYRMVREADKEFIDAARIEHGEHYEYGLNYELANSFLSE